MWEMGTQMTQINRRSPQMLQITLV
jgi:hypothetical protein